MSDVTFFSSHLVLSVSLQFDWEYAQKPDQTSWIAASWVCSSTSKSEFSHVDNSDRIITIHTVQTQVAFPRAISLPGITEALST